MRGKFGLMLVALAIFVATIGGFLFNAETVTTCTTEWDYVADVAGAFEGDRNDMDVEYSPSSNVTGWSHLDEFNNGRLSGVLAEFTDKTNTYIVTVGPAETSTASLTVTADDHSGTSPHNTATIALTGGGSTTADMPLNFGLRNAEAVSFYDHVANGGGRVEAGAFAVPLSALVAAVPGSSEMQTVAFSVSSLSGYPAFAAVNFSAAIKAYTANGATYKVSAETATATASGFTATAYPASGSVQIGDSRVQLTSAYLFWGQAQFNGSGAYTDSVAVSVLGTMVSQPRYMDAGAGIAPTSGTYKDVTVQWVEHDGSSEPSFTLDLYNTVGNASVVDAYCEGSVYVAFEAGGARTKVMDLSFSSGVNGSTLTSVTPAGGQAFSLQTERGSATVTASTSGGVMSFQVDGQDAGSFTVPFPVGVTEMAYVAFSLSADRWMADHTVSVATDGGTGETHRYTAGGSSDEWAATLAYATYSTVETDVPFDRAYWRNGKDNASVSVAFHAPDRAIPYSNQVSVSAGLSTILLQVSYSPSTGWRAGTQSLGDWPAIVLTFGYGKVTATPVSAFESFFDYEAVDSTVTVSTALSEGTIESMTVMSSPANDLRMCVVGTVTRIAEGGLFLQNGVFDASRNFPNSEAVAVMLGSAARMGDSLTFRSGGSSVTVPVDADRGMVYVGGSWQAFDGVRFMWFSSSAPAQTIGGQVYQPAIYYRGESYSPDAIWAEVKGGKVYKVMDAGEGWTLTLDGAWAPAVFLYDGENVASSKTELADLAHPTFQWNANDFIIVMMAVSIIGGVAGSYFKVADLWDWLAIFGTVGVLWLLLG